MYTEAASARRRCTGRRKDGQPCRAWAVWDDPRQLCVDHAGRHHTGALVSRLPTPHGPTRYRPCICAAYAWPHRPGGGRCRWPEPPTVEHPTPAGSHGRWRLRR